MRLMTTRSPMKCQRCTNAYKHQRKLTTPVAIRIVESQRSENIYKIIRNKLNTKQTVLTLIRVADIFYVTLSYIINIIELSLLMIGKPKDSKLEKSTRSTSIESKWGPKFSTECTWISATIKIATSTASCPNVLTKAEKHRYILE